MLRNWKKLLAGAALFAALPWLAGFSLYGPGGAEGIAAKSWQLPAANAGWDIGYNIAGLDIGAPVAADEAYRWNIPEITYGFDEAFMRFFGTNGVKEIDKAIRIFNELPPVSRMSADLSEFPLNTTHLNYEAAQLGLIDLKSVTLSLLVEHMGLGDSVRWVYALRERINFPGIGVYSVIRYNYDPVTLAPSSYVNGTLYTYHILEIPPPVMFSDAVEDIPPGINEPVNIPISSLSLSPALSGYFYDGLTRDDVGGLRFLYTPRNIVAETLLPGTVPGSGTWSPFIGTNFLGGNTNAVGTNALTTAGKRGGVNHVRFRKVHYDTQFFTPFNQTYRDRVVVGGQVVQQSVVRAVTIPDILFTVTDIHPAVADRTTTANWINNELINGVSANGGPGTITPPVVISFNKQLPFKQNITPFFVTEPFVTDTNARINLLLSRTWASFDGSTNPPIIYPTYLNYTIDNVRNNARLNQ
jgi:hypothetical protein